jgi:hypothetical protein
VSISTRKEAVALSAGGVPRTVRTGLGVGIGVGVGGMGVGDGVGVGADSVAAISAPAGVKARIGMVIIRRSARISKIIAIGRRFIVMPLFIIKV